MDTPQHDPLPSSGQRQVVSAHDSDAVATGARGLFKYPQVAVICNETRPVAIVKLEESAFGGRTMLCAVRSNGARYNFGPFTTTSRDEFMKKVKEVMFSIDD